MGNSKVVFGNETLIDLTGDTVEASKMAAGTTAHDAAGNLITGTATEIDLVQETGDSETAVMSQAAVTAELEKQFGEIADLKESGGGAAIIDVVELPTENINEDVFYRLMTGSLVFNQLVQTMYNCYCVETLPATGLPATNLDQTEGNVYYNLADGEVYGYVDDILAMGLGVPTGWYPAGTLLSALGFGYSGVITNILDDPNDGTFRFLLKYVVYSYKDGEWTSHEVIGWRGTGMSAEIFNHPSNIASGDCSHAEGHASHAEGWYSHAEGQDSYAEGNYSHAEGASSHAEGNYSHAEGHASHAEGWYSHAEGLHSHAFGTQQHVQGRYNKPLENYAHIVGNGTNEGNRSNAHTLDWEGNAWFAGSIFMGGTGQDDENAVEVATKQDVNTLNGEIADLKSGNIEIPDYWQTHIDNKISAIKAHQDEAGKDNFSFIVIADPHIPQNLGKISPLLAKHIMDKCDIRHALVLGDFNNRGSVGTKAEAEAELIEAEEMFKCIEELRQRGNHDGSWGATLNGVTYPYNFTEDELYNRIYGKTYRHHDVITDESGTGYYLDDTAKKVRYIMLNTHCNPYVENEDGSAKYNNMKVFRFTQSQYDMVIEALTTVKDGYSVVVGGHVPIVEPYAELWGGDSTTGDYLIMRKLLKAYKDKSTYTASWGGTGESISGGGYTNLYDPTGSGFKQESDTKFYTNWVPYNQTDNGNTGTIYHFKGLGVDSYGNTQPYKMQFAADANGGSASSLVYCTSATGKALTTADYDNEVTLLQHNTNNTTYKYARFEIRTALPDNLIITANEEITENTGGGTSGNYDAVSVDVDFTSANGELVGYFSGHIHNDYLYKAVDGYGIDIITVRCDSQNENDSTLNAERVKGTITEQSFDVFTVNKRTGKIYATKIGAGSDRVIDY